MGRELRIILRVLTSDNVVVILVFFFVIAEEPNHIYKAELYYIMDRDNLFINNC